MLHTQPFFRLTSPDVSTTLPGTAGGCPWAPSKGIVFQRCPMSQEYRGGIPPTSAMLTILDPESGSLLQGMGCCENSPALISSHQVLIPMGWGPRFMAPPTRKSLGRTSPHFPVQSPAPNGQHTALGSYPPFSCQCPAMLGARPPYPHLGQGGWRPQGPLGSMEVKRNWSL